MQAAFNNLLLLVVDDHLQHVEDCVVSGWLHWEKHTHTMGHVLKFTKSLALLSRLVRTLEAAESQTLPTALWCGFNALHNMLYTLFLGCFYSWLGHRMYSRISNTQCMQHNGLSVAIQASHDTQKPALEYTKRRPRYTFHRGLLKKFWENEVEWAWKAETRKVEAL